MARTYLLIFAVCLGNILSSEAQKCQKADPAVNECLLKTLNVFMQNVRKEGGEDLADLEPLSVEDMTVVTGSAPDAFKASLSNLKAHGISNMTFTDLKVDFNAHRFQVSVNIPKLHVTAHVASSGNLFLIKINGEGHYWGEYDGVTAVVNAQYKVDESSGKKHLVVDQITLEFDVKEIKSGVKKADGTTSALGDTVNAFMKSNSKELLKIIKPDLQKKLEPTIVEHINKIVQKIPLEIWVG